MAPVGRGGQRLGICRGGGVPPVALERHILVASDVVRGIGVPAALRVVQQAPALGEVDLVVRVVEDCVVLVVGVRVEGGAAGVLPADGADVDRLTDMHLGVLAPPHAERDAHLLPVVGAVRRVWRADELPPVGHVKLLVVLVLVAPHDDAGRLQGDVDAMERQRRDVVSVRSVETDKGVPVAHVLVRDGGAVPARVPGVPPERPRHGPRVDADIAAELHVCRIREAERVDHQLRALVIVSGSEVEYHVHSEDAVHAGRVERPRVLGPLRRGGRQVASHPPLVPAAVLQVVLQGLPDDGFLAISHLDGMVAAKGGGVVEEWAGLRHFVARAESDKPRRHVDEAVGPFDRHDGGSLRAAKRAVHAVHVRRWLEPGGLSKGDAEAALEHVPPLGRRGHLHPFRKAEPALAA
mmetsp:Transcript_39108/g.92635  ORF Transcript_39108/g.92635 Transcript_39108/m.92635 type:complete len:408 (+) Transcript_39108:792-2015(+)